MLNLSGDRLVWADRRNETGEHYVNFDIYAYDLIKDQEIPVAVAPGSQQSLAVHGDTVVWTDNRNSPLVDTPNGDLPSPGCGDCPENRFDIFSYDFSTGKERVLVETGYFNQWPAIHGEHLAWRAYAPDREMAINLLDLTTGRQRTVTEDNSVWYGPSLSDDYVVWTVGWSCDVFPQQAEGTGVFAQDLKTGEVWKLSDHIEPRAVVSGNMVIIIEGCHFIARVYAVFLE